LEPRSHVPAHAGPLQGAEAFAIMHLAVELAENSVECSAFASRRSAVRAGHVGEPRDARRGSHATCVDSSATMAAGSRTSCCLCSVTSAGVPRFAWRVSRLCGDGVVEPNRRCETGERRGIVLALPDRSVWRVADTSRCAVPTAALPSPPRANQPNGGETSVIAGVFPVRDGAGAVRS